MSLVKGQKKMHFNRSFMRLLSVFLLMGPLAQAQSWTAIKDWKYIPQDDKFWNHLEEQNKSLKPEAVLELAFEQADKKDITTPAGAEYYLALADGLGKAKFFQAAFEIYIAVLSKFPGTALSQKSLVEIEKLGLQTDLDEEELSRVINQAAFTEIPESAREMALFFVVLDDMNKGLYRWAQTNLKAIGEGTQYWQQRLRFYKDIEDYTQGKVEAAEKDLKALAETPGIAANLKWKVQLQRARIHFEKAEYDQAEELYYNTEFPPRVYGRVLLELAWVKYHKKDYSWSLGLLESLKSPVFRVASNPEQYLLAMIAYRDLCHYPKVLSLSEEFQRKYQSTFDMIKAGKPLTENLVLMWQVLQKPYFRDQAIVLEALNKESKRLSELGVSAKNTAFQYVTSATRDKELQFKKRIERNIQKDLRKQADEFLISWDQVKLAEYISKLDKYRIKPTYEARRYEATRADNYTFDTLFWPVADEYWTEELKNYRVLLSDQCGAPTSSVPGGKK